MAGYLKDINGSICFQENPDDSDITILKRKLQAKTDALMVLSQEFDQCRTQRDQFKLMAEQIQERFWYFKKQANDSRNTRKLTLDDDFRTMDLLTEAREQNKCLRLQVETLRQKLGDVQGDIKVLRTSNHLNIDNNESQFAPAIHEREQLIEQLENLNIKYTQLKQDIKTLVDEKLELETERDAFKCKAHRLNHELSKALNATQPVDLDSLINENRYLQERIEQLIEEKELARQSLSKYKGMLDSKKIKGTIKLGANGTAGTAGKVMTLKQVEQLLGQEVNISAQKSAGALADLRCLCSALLESLNDKTLALMHQKKANKILAARICELNKTVPSPTSKLLEGYAGSNVDDIEEEFIRKTLEDNLTQRDDNQYMNIKSSSSCSENPTPTKTKLPQNLEDLVQKALLNLEENEKNN